MSSKITSKESKVVVTKTLPNLPMPEIDEIDEIDTSNDNQSPAM
jgi:hypothetical protein